MNAHDTSHQVPAQTGCMFFSSRDFRRGISTTPVSPAGASAAEWAEAPSYALSGKERTMFHHVVSSDIDISSGSGGLRGVACACALTLVTCATASHQDMSAIFPTIGKGFAQPTAGAEAPTCDAPARQRAFALPGGTNGSVGALTLFDDGSGGGPALYAGGTFTTSSAGDVYLTKWGCAGTAFCPGNFNDDGVIDGADLGLLLGAWGSCS